MLLPLCAIHRQPITITMPCSVCQQSGHNKRTCELNTKVATTGKYAGMTAVQIEAIFAERERKNYEELVAPIIAPKSACADCGQIETECRLELVGGKVMCCDCLYPENPTEYEEEEEEDDDKTVSVIGDLCECCGRPYDDRNPLRQSEMCDCVQNDDGTLSRPEESDDESDDETETDDDETVSVVSEDDKEELPCGKCDKWFHYKDESLEVIERFEYNEISIDITCADCRAIVAEKKTEKPPSPTRDQLIALGKYKLAKFQIGKQDQRDETNWNEDGDDELCSAIDASGNALY